MRSELTLPTQPSAARDARQFVLETLGGWDVETDVHDAELIVSELVTSAARFEGQDLTVSVTWNSAGVWIDVVDGDTRTRVPRLVAAQHAFETGRALTIVDSLAESWGVVPTNSGKHVWVHLADASRAQEKQLARAVVSGQVHRIQFGDDDHGGMAVTNQLASLGTDSLRRVASELAHLAAHLTCLCAAYEDTDAVDFWTEQVSRMQLADRADPGAVYRATVTATTRTSIRGSVVPREKQLAH
jgi:hypothetical protein